MNWFAYRLPGESGVETGSSGSLIQGIGEAGFAIAPFDRNPDGLLTIPEGPSTGIFESEEDTDESLYEFPSESTSALKHAENVIAIKRLIGEGRLGKCVAARVIVREGRIDLRETFLSLCNAYPEAFVFCFHTSVTGTWIGASPETLLIKKGNTLTSMALAGTRPVGTGGEWDKKNIEEQQVVSGFISDTLIENGFMPQSGDTHTYAAGPVEHIRTVFTAHDVVSDKETCLHKSLKTAFDLSPTPALAGYPRAGSMEAIAANEDFERGYYGGFCGPVTADGDFSFFVNLRSMRILPDRLCVYAGGGIMKDSDPAAEWEETERKAQTCLGRIRKTNDTVKR